MDFAGLLDGDPRAALPVIALRTLIMFIVALVFLRLSSRRFLGRHSALDWVLAVILGSVLSRAINGDAPLLTTIAAGLVLVALNWLFGAGAVRWRWLDRLIHGRPIVLVEDGQLKEAAMRRHHFTVDDVLEDVRNAIQSDRLDDVQLALLERNGRLTVVRRRPR
jgi:uncharacterized membrane protein YcaP (DUF421 family)